MSAKEVDDYLSELEEPKRRALEGLRQSILDIVPDAEQGLSYGVPVFLLHGKAIAGFSVAKNHLSYLPHSGEVLSAIDSGELEGFRASKGALRFTLDHPPAGRRVELLIAARRREANV